MTDPTWAQKIKKWLKGRKWVKCAECETVFDCSGEVPSEMTGYVRSNGRVELICSECEEQDE